MVQNLQNKLIWLLSFIALLFVVEDISAQMDVRVLGNASNCSTCKNRTEFWVGVYHNSGGGADAGGDNESSWEVCGDQANSGWGPTLYCPGGVVRVQGHTAGRNRTLGVWTTRTCVEDSPNNYHTINGTANQTGTVSTSGGSGANINYTVQTSGNFRVNARVGSENFSCANAWQFANNVSGDPLISNHTTNCGDAWYKYTLTQSNRTRLEFEPTANGVNTSEIVTVLYEGCNGCNLSDNNSGIFSGNTYRIDDPKPGTYYIRVHVSKTAVIGNKERAFKLRVSTGSANTSKPANDDVCYAESLSSNWNFNSGNLSRSTNTNNASSEDFCYTNEPDNDNEKSVWYKFTTGNNPPTSFEADVGASATLQKAHVVLYKLNGNLCSGTAPNFSALSKVQESGSVSTNFTVDCPDANSVYYLQVKTRTTIGGSASGGINFTLRNSATPKPTNDNVCNALNIGSGSSAPGTTITTGQGKGINNFCSSGSGEGAWPTSFSKDQTVWYKFSTGATVGSLVKVEVRSDPANHGDNISSELAVFKRASCSSGTVTRVAEHNPTPIPGGVNSEAYFCPEPNTNYWVLVDHDPTVLSSDEGYFEVRVTHLEEAADNFCDATDISNIFPGGALSKGISRNYKTISNYCATSEPQEPNAGRSVWLKFKTGSVVGDLLTVDASGIDGLGTACVGWARVDVYTSTANSCSIDSLVQNNVKAVFDQSKYEIECPRADTWYYLQLQDRSLGCNRLTMEVDITMSNTTNADVPDNDDVCDASNLGNSSGLVLPNITTQLNNQNNGCASMESGEQALGGAGAGGRTIWYKFKTDDNPPIDATIDASFNNPLVNNKGNCDAFLIPETFFPRVRAYKSSQSINNNCSQINHLSSLPDEGGFLGVDLQQGKFKIGCLEPNTWYYIQVYTGVGSVCDDGSFDIKLIGGEPIQPGPDYICIPATSTVAGEDGYLGTLNSSNNTELKFVNQTTRCATVSGGEPDRTTALSSLNNTVWYRFTTPDADYSDNTLMHLYDVEVKRLSSSSTLTYPALYIYKESGYTNRSCGDNASDYNNLTYIDRDEIDPGAIVNSGNARVRDLCLEPNTNYYIQVDPIGLGKYVDFDLVVRKSAFRPGNNICDATVMPSNIFTGLNKETPPNHARMSGAPFFGLPHSNKCASSEPGEPSVEPGSPSGPGNNYSASVWYQFTTGSDPAEWIEWDHSSKLGRGHRGGGCILGEHFGSNIFMYESKNNTCSYPSLQVQSEYDFPWETPGASTKPGVFRLRCPQPNTTYYVQVQDADFFSAGISTCYEGVYDLAIKTAPTTKSPPVNDEPCGAIFLGTVPVGGKVERDVSNNNKLFDNFCATPSYGFNPDPDHELKRDVWFTFVAPPSGSVMITAQSAPTGSPSADKNIDLQVAIWEPIMGEHNQEPNCSDPRYLWTPIVSRNHGILDFEDASLLGVFDTYYDIVDTRSNILTIKGNSLIASCLSPGKLYYIQVDGDDYFMCDFLNGGDCTMGYFGLQVTDAGLYDMASMKDLPAGNDEPCGAKTLTVQSFNKSESQLTWQVGSNLCATGFSDPLPSTWYSTDATVWYKFIAPASGKVKIRAKGNGRINKRDKFNPNAPDPLLSTSNPDYHDNINLQLGLYTMGNCLNKSSLTEITSSYDGALVEMNPSNEDDYVGLITNGHDEYMVARCLIPGREYYIMVDGENDPTIGITSPTQGLLPNSIKYVTGDFKISVQDDAPIPASTNDDICDAFEITGVHTLSAGATKTTGLFSNECATIEPEIEGAGKVAEKIKGKLWGTINTSPATAKHTLWFKFRAPSSGKVNIRAVNSNDDKMDIAMALYDLPGEKCHLASSGYMIEGDYDPGVVSGHAEMDVECLVPGRYYYLQVDGQSNNVLCTLGGENCERGIFHLEIKHLNDAARSDIPPQKNDNLCDAINLGNLNPNVTLTRVKDNNRCSTEEINEPGGYGWNFSLFDDQLRGVWYKFKTGAGFGSIHPGPITIEVTNPSKTCLNLHVELFEYQGVFNSGACANQSNSNTQFNNLFKVGKGSSFLTRSEKLEMACPKPNTEYFVRVTGTASALCAGFGTTQGEFDLKVSMSGVSISSPPNDDICDAYKTGNIGNFGVLNSGQSKIKNNHNNICATQELDEPNTTQSAVQSEAEYDETTWYTFRTSSSPGKIKVRLKIVAQVGVANVSSIVVYKGNTSNYNPCTRAFSGLIELGDSWASSTALGGFSVRDAVIELPCPSPNWNYFIQVDGYDISLLGMTIPGYTDEILYDISIEDDGSGNTRPVNDDIANAIPVDDVAPLNGQLTAGGMLTIKGNNLCATVEPNEPNVDNTISDHQKSGEDETVWFYFVTPNDPGIINVRVQEDTDFSGRFRPNFTVYYNNGTAPTYARITEAPSSKLVQEGTTSTAAAYSTNKNYTCLLPNTKYYIQVDGNDIGSDQGHFIVTVTDDGSGSPAPTNDLICKAEDITSNFNKNGSVTLNRSNKCSWEEVDEPNTSGGIEVTKNTYDHTVWYKFRPNWDGKYTVSIDNNTHKYTLYRSVGGAYNCTNPNWDNLTRMSKYNLKSEDFSCLLENTWYYLQVKGNVGDFNLTVSHSSESVPDHDMVCYAYDFGTVENTTAAVNSQNNTCATQEIDEPGIDGDYHDINSVRYDKTLWYKFKTPAQIGDWDISVTNQSPINDRISATFTLYESSKTSICSGATPVWTNLDKKLDAGIANVTTGNNDVSIECYKLKPNQWYYIQVHGEDYGPFGEVGTNFRVAVKHTPVLIGNNDNVCQPVTLTVGGAPYADNNYCATSQDGEIDIDPTAPQDPFNDGRKYDETMWYRFRAPAQGYVDIIAKSSNLHMELDLYEIPNGTSVCVGSQPEWHKLLKIDSKKSTLVGSKDISLKNKCLVPNRWYLIRIDGNDGIGYTDRGDYTIQVVNEYEAQPVVCTPVLNDEPCNLPSAFDISEYVREDPCPSGNMNYVNNYTVSSSTSPRVDCASRSDVGMPCGGMVNCSDYWFKFTVPMDSEGGVRIQGDDEYGAANSTNSKQVVAAYRGNPCTGQLQYLGCDHGGTGRDVEFDIAAIPGETIYLQVFNDNAPSNPNYTAFGLCVSTRCVPKTDCDAISTLSYDVPQCWNLVDKNTSGNDGLYGKCLPNKVKSENYFTFSTECGATADGEPDTVTIVFSVTDVSSNTALAIYEDATPCDGLEDATVINCVPFGNCVGCSPITTFSQTYQLDECKTYVIQIVGEDDGDKGSSGQIFIFKSDYEPPVLPVELITFIGYHNGVNNALHWSTASERNTEQFIVEKSIDGKNFSAIGIVGANGNTGEVQSYNFIDVDAWAGSNFYRLRIVDFDGKYEFSNIINIDVSAPKDLSENKTKILSLYPNPTDGKTNVEMYVHEKQADFEIKVVNILGQVMHTEHVSFSKGEVAFGVDATKYAQGEYVVVITHKSTSESFNVKLVKQ